MSGVFFAGGGGGGGQECLREEGHFKKCDAEKHRFLKRSSIVTIHHHLEDLCKLYGQKKTFCTFQYLRILSTLIRVRNTEIRP